MSRCFLRSAASSAEVIEPMVLVFTSTKAMISAFSAIISISPPLTVKFLFIISYPCLTRKPQTASSPILPAFRRWVWSMPIFLCIILFEKTHSMYPAWSILVYHLIVELCAIALMLLKPILRILFSHLLHIPVPCDLCKN